MESALDVSELAGDPLRESFQRSRIDHWNEVARLPDSAAARGYHRRLEEIYRFLVPRAP